MKNIVVFSVFLVMNLVAFGQRNNFGGPSTTFQMQQNAQRATQFNNYQRQQFDQMNRDRQMHQQVREQNQMQMRRNASKLEQPKDKPKKERKEKKVRKTKAAKNKDAGVVKE